MIDYLAIVQARLNSSRFPNKVLKEVDGIPLVVFLLKRLSQSKKINKIFIIIITVTIIIFGFFTYCFIYFYCLFLYFHT